MAIVATSNLAPATGAAILYALKELLKTAGWTVRASGDGIAAYGAASDVITNNGAGANGMNNTGAWFRIRMPGAGTREFVIQRGNAATNTRMKYSATDGFVGGAPSATQCPSAADEQVLVNLTGGTDAAPTGSNFCGTVNKALLWADNAAPYGWGMHGWSGAGAETFGIMLDACAPGTYPATDIDPYVFLSYPNSNLFGLWATMAVNANLNNVCWFAKDLGGEVWGVVASMALGNTGGQIGQNVTFPVNKCNAKDDDTPIFYGNSVNGYKGMSYYTKYCSIIRATLSTQTVNAALDRIIFGNGVSSAISVPNGGVAPTL